MAKSAGPALNISHFLSSFKCSSLAFPFYQQQTAMSFLSLFRDPWAKNEAWRKSSVFSNRVMFRSLFPGFGIAVVAFTAYVVVDNVVLSTNKSQSHHH